MKNRFNRYIDADRYNQLNQVNIVPRVPIMRASDSTESEKSAKSAGASVVSWPLDAGAMASGAVLIYLARSCAAEVQTEACFAAAEASIAVKLRTGIY